MFVNVNILCWNDVRYLPDLFASLESQTYKNSIVRVLDNGSTDGSTEYIKANYPFALAARNVRNLGFAPGHNQLVRLVLERSAGMDLRDVGVLLVNADMILRESCIGELVRALESDPELDAVQPKVLRAFHEHEVGDVDVDAVRSDVVDTAGLRLARGWRLVDRGAGEVDRGQFDGGEGMFGVSGAMMLMRASSLLRLLVDGEMFDGEFNTYREDCDLAMRMAHMGMKTAFVPKAIVHHYRGMYGAERQTLWQRLRNRQKQRPFFAALSTRNQLFVLLKNLTFFEFLRAAPAIAANEGGRVLYGLLFEPETRKVLLAAWRLVPSMLRKRGIIRRMRLTSHL